MRRVLPISLAFVLLGLAAFGQFQGSPKVKVRMSKTEKYVRALYRDVHNREGDAEGIKYWTSQLKEKKSTKEEVVKAFLNSPEYRERFIKNLYGWFHDRVPDEAGLEYWTGFMKDNDEGDVMRSFVLSDEFWEGSDKNYRDWLGNLYWTLHSREPDAEGFTYWMKELKKGTPRASVVDEFMDSREYHDRFIRFLYDWYHKREPDQSGLDYWSEQFGEMTERQIILEFLTGSEYWQRITE